MKANVSTLLGKLIRLLDRYNYSDRASWLQDKQDDLQSANTDSERKVILNQIKNNIAGMGSLSDIYIILPKNSSLSELEANRTFYDLVMELDEAVRAELSIRHA